MEYLHCFFVVKNENESALIVGSKFTPFLRWRWMIQFGCTADNMSTISAKQLLQRHTKTKCHNRTNKQEGNKNSRIILLPQCTLGNHETVRLKSFSNLPRSLMLLYLTILIPLEGKFIIHKRIAKARPQTPPTFLRKRNLLR